MLNISIVTYQSDWSGEVIPLVKELCLSKYLHKLYIVDNSPKATDLTLYLKDWEHAQKVRYILTGENLGYGKAHNIAIRETIFDKIPFHLVINSDIIVKAKDIDTLYEFMAQNPLVGQLMPRVVDPNGDIQHLCKRLPSPLDVFARRFMPSGFIQKRNARYELHHMDYDRPMNVPNLSGCFMFLRTEAIQKARLFDERYFLYLEDLDLTRTIHRDYLTLYYPAVSIVHNHKQASYHSKKMLWIHIVNMCRYFRKWGWLFDNERKEFNRNISQ